MTGAQRRWLQSEQLFDSLHECLLVRAHDMDASIEGLPDTPEDFALVVTHMLVSVLSSGLGTLAAGWGWHPGDKRWDRPDPADQAPPG